MRALFLLIPTVSGIMPLTAATATVPPIGNIANFVVKTDDLEEARRFYSGVLGYDEVFRHKRPVSGPAELSVFKVNERQYIEVSPTLHNTSDDKLIQIGYATADARKLRDYLAAHGVAVPSHHTLRRIRMAITALSSKTLRDTPSSLFSISRVRFSRDQAARESRIGAFPITCCMLAYM